MKEQRAVELLREHDPAASVRPGAAERIEARLRRPVRKRKYVAAVVVGALVLSTAGFAAIAVWQQPWRVYAPPVVVAPPAPPVVIEAPAAPRPSSLVEEARLLERVAQDVKNGRTDDALAGVDAHQSKYPAGVLRLEALGFRVQAFEQLRPDEITDAIAEQWVSALSQLGRCREGARLVKQAVPAQRRVFARAVKGLCAP